MTQENLIRDNCTNAAAIKTTNRLPLPGEKAKHASNDDYAYPGYFAILQRFGESESQLAHWLLFMTA